MSTKLFLFFSDDDLNMTLAFIRQGQILHTKNVEKYCSQNVLKTGGFN